MKKAAEIDIDKIDTQSTEFQNALNLIKYTSQSVFLTGKAGTGKSTFLQYLTRTTKKKFVVLAPTGIAAVNAGGQTLHSFFKLPFKPMLPDDPEMSSPRRLRDRMKYSKNFVKLLQTLDLIIIDEVSMVRADTIDFIDKILRVYCGNNRLPFAGKQMLLIGDVFQLEPVITGDVRDVLNYYYRDGSFFFNAMAFKALSVVPIELTKVYRQTDDGFIQMLDRIRVGRPLPSDISLLNGKVDTSSSLIDSDFTITLASRRDIVDHINHTRLDALNRPPRRFIGQIKGDFPDSSLPTEKELVLKEGAQVVFVKNDPERRWVNGTIGIITDFGEDSITVETEDGKKHAVGIDLWENIKYEYDEEKRTVIEKVLGSYAQYPLKLAWALTIHKSQGLTFDKVIIDMGTGAFSGGQSYVALSRCRSLDGIKMRSTLNDRDIFVNPRVVEFSRKFNDGRLITSAMDNARAYDLYQRAAKAFNEEHYADAVDFFSQAVAIRNELDKPNAARLLKQKLLKLASLQTQVDELQKQLDDNRKRFDQLASEYVEMGESCRDDGWDMDAAIANFDKALSLSPTYALALIGKGKALVKMEEFEKAIDCYDRAAALDPKDWRALVEAGRLLIDTGEVAIGMDYLLRALQRNEKIPAVHLALADGYERIGDDDNAALHRKKASKYSKK